jgi:hypothetical protein
LTKEIKDGKEIVKGRDREEKTLMLGGGKTIGGAGLTLDLKNVK